MSPTGPHPLLRLAGLFRGRPWLLAASVLGLLGAAGLGLAGPWLISIAIDVDIAGGDVDGLTRRAALYAAVLVGTFALSYWSRVGIETTAQRAMLRLKEQLFQHLLRADLATHDRNPSGRLITRVQSDTENLRLLFTEVIFAFPADLTLFVGMFGVMLYTAPDVALPVFGVLPPYLLALWLLRRFGPPAFLELRVQRAQLTGFFAEHLGAMTMLQRFDRSSWVRERAEQRNEAVYAAQVRSGLIPVVYFNGVVLIRSLGIVALLLYGSMRVAEGSLTVGGLVMGLGYLRQMFSPLMRLSHHLTAIETSRAAAVRISEILDTEAQICDPAEPVPWPGLRDEMALRDVTFHYQEDAPVLRGVDIKIRAGSHVGIVGATGAGKSTVLNLAMRFRDPVGGAVTVDGVDLRAMAVEDVRRHMGLVLQDVRLLPGTVLDNLGGQRDAARTALDTVGLAGVGLDTVVRSGMLSRGERQLLTFARALVGDPELLVLDEATSAVDPATEARVQQSLRRVMAGRTTITVAHRLQTVRDADQIYVLQEGWVAEVGNHDALLRADGVYAALHALQRPLP